ncbi:MAG: hypothetical protein AAFP77_10895 [Bacteroidota bacterium]
MKQPPCHQGKKARGKLLPKVISWFPALAVAILPKCPFCLMAYSGAVSLCSGNMLFPNAGTWASYLTMGLAVVVFLSIILNRKGSKTWFALGLVTIGIVFLVAGQFLFISEFNYYLGVGFLFFGIWLNGSFLHYYHKTRAFLSTQKISTISKHLNK